MTTHIFDFTPSEYQQAIIDEVVGGSGDLVVNAVAGSGKSATLKMIAQVLRKSRVFSVAFNKHIADHLSQQLKQFGTEVKTINAFGHGVCIRNIGGQIKLETRKYSKIIGYTLEESAPFKYWINSNKPEHKQWLDEAKKWLRVVVEKVRLTLTDFNNSEALISLGYKFGVTYAGDHFDALVKLVAVVINEGIKVARNHKVIDFADQVFLPVHLNWSTPTFDYVMVDEAQDLNNAQRKLIFKARSPLGGRMIFVGDKFQAIYAFSGANAQSFDLIQSELNAKQLPLSVCYRCPSSHIRMAQHYMPAIEPRDNAPVGEYQVIKLSDTHSHIKVDDLVLCRFTAPLVGLCISLIKKRVPARVRGRDVGNELAELAEKIGGMVEWDLFLTALRAYRENQYSYLVQQEADDQMFILLDDKVEALSTCYTDFGAGNIQELSAMIRDMFSDDRASVYLSTIHRAKGLEAAHVLLVGAEDLPLTRGDAEQLEQEKNLLYVALTRATEKLTFVAKDEYAQDDMNARITKWLAE